MKRIAFQNDYLPMLKAIEFKLWRGVAASNSDHVITSSAGAD
jgi:hypothetical protein